MSLWHLVICHKATISLIAKKGKDPLLCSSYRPISLLNVDSKILAKVLALRLETVLPTIISPDQTGFIQNRHSFSNIRLFNIIYNPGPSNSQEAVISLDAEKAFDRVEWAYLFYTIKRFGFGERFFAWIQLLYSNPHASVRTNDINSEYFRLSRSTRQGCPLSSLLFSLAIEPLAIALRSNPNIKGIIRNGVETKISLYADDPLLSFTDLNCSAPVSINMLNDFGHLSGYKLTFIKSELFPVNSSSFVNVPLGSLPFKFAPHSFTYLGIQVTPKYKDLFAANFTPLLARVKEDFERWSILGLSLVARINCI